MFSKNKHLVSAQRRSAPLIAAMMILSAFVGTTAEGADAARFSDGSVGQLSVNCHTIYTNVGARHTLELLLFASHPNTYVRKAWYVNGALVGYDTGWQPLTAGISTRAEVHVPGWSGFTVQYIVQFVRWVNGRWEYSPSAGWEYASHSTQTINQSGDRRHVNWNAASCSFLR